MLRSHAFGLLSLESAAICLQGCRALRRSCLHARPWPDSRVVQRLSSGPSLFCCCCGGQHHVTITHPGPEYTAPAHRPETVSLSESSAAHLRGEGALKAFMPCRSADRDHSRAGSGPDPGCSTAGGGGRPLHAGGQVRGLAAQPLCRQPSTGAAFALSLDTARGCWTRVQGLHACWLEQCTSGGLQTGCASACWPCMASVGVQQVGPSDTS